jgi:hypothetical protein
MASIEDFYPSKFLKASDIEEDTSVTIHEVGRDNFRDDDGANRLKPIIYFRERGVKPLICNKTNFQRIAEVAGADTDDWAGTRLVLFADKVSMHGKSVDPIRVRPAPKAKKPEPVSEVNPPPFDDPIEELTA